MGLKESSPLELKPIGVIHSPYAEKAEVPYQGGGHEVVSQVELFPEFEEGLKDIEGFSHIILIYWMHQSKGYSLMVRTPWDSVIHGLFATRSPNRPCPLGLSVVELVSREGGLLAVRGVDALDGTPLLDIKPYIPSIDEKIPVRGAGVRANSRLREAIERGRTAKL